MTEAVEVVSMEKQPLAEPTVAEASCSRRKSWMRLRPSTLLTVVLLFLSWLGYLWLSASRTMLVNIRVSETLIVRTSLGETSTPEGLQPRQLGRLPNEFKRCRGAEPGVVLPHLRSVRQWLSSRPRQEESVTLVTQLSLERLGMLENQCSVWLDPIAAVVYVPTLRGRILSEQDPSLNGTFLEEAIERLGSFHTKMHTEGSCALDLELATEDFGEEGEAGLYPFNAARNRALMLAQTEVLLLLDADFVPAPTWLAEYKTAEAYGALVQRLNRPGVIVLPAFETNNRKTSWKTRNLAMTAVKRGKQYTLDKWRQGSLVGFAMNQGYKKGHFPTNYKLWAETDLLYTVQYEKGYEPYVLISRRFAPWYDERFRGYGWNKIQHLTHLAGLNVTFDVHPHGFVVHVPHQDAATKRITADSGQKKKLRVLFNEVVEGISNHTFSPVVSFPHLCSH